MAIVKQFLKRDGSGVVHPTEVTAQVMVFGAADRAQIVQIDTYGSKTRKIPGKVSQTFQLDEAAARELFEILKQTYHFK